MHYENIKQKIFGVAILIRQNRFQDKEYFSEVKREIA